MTLNEFTEQLTENITEELRFWALSNTAQRQYIINNFGDDIEDATAYFENRYESLRWNYDKCTSDVTELWHDIYADVWTAINQ